MAEQIYVIVGASLAGAKAAQTLREEGFTGRIVLLGEEAERPDPGIAPVQDLIRSAAPVDHHRLADPAVPLTDLLSRHGAISGFSSAL